MARSERTALCNTALEAGEDAPTLCGTWTVKDLICHLLVRERSPLGAPGILVPKLEGLADRSMRRLQSQDFTALVERVRGGPPKWAPFALPPVDHAVNTVEFLIHHEDIRRARSGWVPREVTEHEQDSVWKLIRVAGKGLVRRAGVPVAIVRPDGTTTVLRKGEDPAVVTGEPVELALFLFGRDEVCRVEFSGPEAHVAALRGADRSA